MAQIIHVVRRGNGEIRMGNPSRHSRSGFTLVELLVVIAIIGVLVALLLPAVQSAREAARRSQCANQIRQMALGILQHEETYRHFPTGGWGWGWIGDPDRGTDERQHAGWIYNTLPFLEEQTLYSLPQKSDPAARRAAFRQMYETPIPIFNCPSRRAAIPYPYKLTDPHPQFDNPKVVGRGDYAINCGSEGWCELGFGPRDVQQGDDPTYKWNDMKDYNGISYERSKVRIADVIDGTTHTYLVGEKNLNPDNYATGEAADDNSGLYTGFENDNYRGTGKPPQTPQPPLRDAPGAAWTCNFGSAHASVWQMSFCDGSVKSMAYDIDPLIHSLRGDRRDEQVIAEP